MTSGLDDHRGDDADDAEFDQCARDGTERNASQAIVVAVDALRHVTKVTIHAACQ